MKDLSCRELPAAIHRLETPVDWPPGHAAFYLIEADEPVLIDAGNPGTASREVFVEQLQEHGYMPGDVQHVLVSHPHIDHVGQTRAVIGEGDPTVYIMRDAEKYLTPEGWRPKFERGFREVGLPDGVREQAVEEMMDTFTTSEESLPTQEIDVLLEAGEEFSAGGVDFRSVHVPGHQKYQLCYEATVEDTRVLFAGDAVARDFRPLTFHTSFDGGMHDGVEAYYRGLRRLQDRNVDVVYPGHGPVFHDLQAAVESSLEGLDELVEDAASTVGVDDEVTALELTMQRVGSDPEMIRHNLLDTVGALGYLEAEGRVESILTDGVRRYTAVK